MKCKCNKSKTIKTFICFIVFLTMIINLSGCSNSNEEKMLEEKLLSEIEYLNTKLITMINKVNGISFENYIVIAEQIGMQGDNSSKTMKNTGEQTSSEESEGEETTEGGGQKENSGGNSGSESSGGGQSENSSSSGNSTEQSEKNYMDYKMESNHILGSSREADWNSLTSDVESLYSSWTTVVLDLYKVSVNNQDILSFSTDLDSVANGIKSQDKAKTLTSIAKLYSYIPKYVGSFSKDNKQNSIYQTKSNVLNAYSLIDQGKKDEVKQELSNAEQAFIPIINNVTEVEKQNNTNKAYILLKELQSSVDNEDTDIFYIKYKNLIEELNIISN